MRFESSIFDKILKVCQIQSSLYEKVHSNSYRSYYLQCGSSGGYPFLLKSDLDRVRQTHYCCSQSRSSSTSSSSQSSELQSPQTFSEGSNTMEDRPEKFNGELLFDEKSEHVSKATYHIYAELMCVSSHANMYQGISVEAFGHSVFMDECP